MRGVSSHSDDGKLKGRIGVNVCLVSAQSPIWTTMLGTQVESLPPPSLSIDALRIVFDRAMAGSSTLCGEII